MSAEGVKDLYEDILTVEYALSNQDMAAAAFEHLLHAVRRIDIYDLVEAARRYERRHDYDEIYSDGMMP